MSQWRAVTSKLSRREGEAFVLKGDTFVLKVYKGAVPDTLHFAQYLAKQMNQLEARQLELRPMPDHVREALNG